ncbi:hypothetical protein F5Y08DRAFT_345329 [Xylaria arbuscula]|nr:hypothetical protein F5Y08DRAFT_345329 [Xylaria arbuscula]
MPEEQHSVGKVKELPKMTQEITQRRACDRCHGLKLRCRRSDGEQCERCRKANQTCTSSPSLRHHKKKSPRGRTIGSMSRPIQIRPGPIEATGDAPPLPPQRERVSCDSMSQSEQAPAAASPFEDTANKHIARPPSLPGAELSLTTPQRPAVLKSHILSQPKQGGCGALPERHSTDLAELEYLQLRPPLPYSQFQDIARLNQVKQTLLGYLNELNLAHDAYQTLDRDTTCRSTGSASFEIMMVPPYPLPQLSIKELLHLSQRFTSTLHMMASTGMLTAQHVDPALPLLVYSRMQDVHSLALQLINKSLELPKNAMACIITQSSADELPPAE